MKERTQPSGGFGASRRTAEDRESRFERLNSSHSALCSVDLLRPLVAEGPLMAKVVGRLRYSPMTASGRRGPTLRKYERLTSV